MTDIEIAQKNVMEPIVNIAKKIDISSENLELYGNYKAKISFNELKILQEKAEKNPGKLILVTAITPTAAGEGKSTVSIGLSDGLNKIGKKTVVALREPSLGPCFGVKGGACGGGYAQIVPMEDINLHFTGDIHAISIANNLISALIDNHLQQGNELNIDPRTISWKRCVDLNDRALRNITIGLGGRMQGVPREDHFTIAVASEIMAIVCLSKTISDLKKRIDKIVIGQNYAKQNVTFGQLKCTGAIAALLKDVIKPNLVQTLEKNPAFVHGGPFANIAHGCNSVLATRMALKCGEYTVTEAGFGGDLGAEKFFDIKCRTSGLVPSCVVLVATVRALKLHGGVKKDNLKEENPLAVREGCSNLRRHIRNMKDVFGLPVVVALNRFLTDTPEEIEEVRKASQEEGVDMILAQGWEKGGEGMVELAEKVLELCEMESKFTFAYDSSDSLEDKIKKLVTKVYGGAKVNFAPGTRTKLKKAQELGMGSSPVCMAKTQYSFSDDPKKLGAPENFTLTVSDIRISRGAGFVVVLTGDIMTMPGLPKVPQAELIDVSEDGTISGLM